MQDNRGNLVDLDKFKKQFLDAMPARELGWEDNEGWQPVMQATDGAMAKPEGKSKAEMNEAMKAAGWTRAERRRYLSPRKDNP